MEAEFQPVVFRPVFTPPPQVDVLCASVSTNPKRILLALSNSSIALISSSGTQSLGWFTDPRLLIVAIAQNSDQIGILTLKGFCFVLDYHFFLASNWAERWAKFVGSEFLAALETTTAATDEDFLDAFGLCSSVRPGKSSRPGKNSVNALCMELRSESVFSSLDWWGECLIAGALLGDLYFIDSRTGAKECLVQIPTEMNSISIARDGGVFLLIESAMKVYFWLILQPLPSSESLPFTIISMADADYFQPYALSKFTGKAVSIQQHAGADAVCVFSQGIVEVYVCSNLKSPAVVYEVPGDAFDFICLFACYLICLNSTEKDTKLTVFLKPHPGAQRKTSPDQGPIPDPDPKDAKLCLCATGCATSKAVHMFSYAKWLGMESSLKPAMESLGKLSSELLQQVILYSLHNAPSVFLASLRKAISETKNSVERFRLEILNVRDWMDTLRANLGERELLAEVYNVASVLYRVKQDRAPGLIHVMLTVLCRLSPKAPVPLRLELLPLPLTSPFLTQKPLIDLNAGEAEFFCDLCAGIDLELTNPSSSVQDLLKTLISERFADLSCSLQIRLILVAEQLQVPDLPTEKLFLVANRLSECALMRVICKCLSYEFLASLHSPLLSDGEKYVKLLPIHFKSAQLVSRTTSILQTSKAVILRLPVKSLIWKAEKMIADFRFLSDIKPKSASKVSLTLSRLLMLLAFSVHKYRNEAVIAVFRVVYQGLTGRFDDFKVKSAAVTLKAYKCLRLIAECEGDLPSALKCELLIGDKGVFEGFEGYFRQAKTQKEQCLLLQLTLQYLMAKGWDSAEFQAKVTVRTHTVNIPQSRPPPSLPSSSKLPDPALSSLVC